MAFVLLRVAQEVLKFPDAPEDVAMHKNNIYIYIYVFKVVSMESRFRHKIKNKKLNIIFFFISQF